MKKLLALVLALVMTLGLATVGANAAFADAESIEHSEAADILNALGVIDGKENNNFDPKGDVKRSEMAKMVAITLLGDVDASAFKGTPVNLDDINGHWAEGWIKFCVIQGIVGGKGNGKFDPDANVTAVEAAKMLLVAIGYDAKVQGYIGDQWQINVVRDAQQKGFYDELRGLSADKALTRDEAAQMIYNAARAGMIIKEASQNRDSNGLITDSYVDTEYRNIAAGGKLTLLWDTFEAYEIEEAQLTGITYDNDKGEYVYTITGGTATVTPGAGGVPAAPTIATIRGRLRSTTDYSDLYGMTVHTVSYEKNNRTYLYGMYADNGAKVLENTILGGIDVDAKGTGGDYTVKANGNKYETDGTTNALFFPFNMGFGAAIAAGLVGNTVAGTGVIKTAAGATNNNAFGAYYTAKVIDNDGDGEVDIIIYKPVEVAKVTYAGSNNISVDNTYTVPGAVTSFTYADNTIEAGIAKDDYVLITRANNTPTRKPVITKIADSVSGTVSRINSYNGTDGSTATEATYAKEIAIDGTKYNITRAVTGGGANLDVTDVVTASSIGKTLKAAVYNTFLFDVDAVSKTGVDKFAIVTAAETSVGALSKYLRANLLFSDGTSQVVNVAKNYGTTGDNLINKLVVFTESDGVYRLAEIKNTAAWTGVGAGAALPADATGVIYGKDADGNLQVTFPAIAGVPGSVTPTTYAASTITLDFTSGEGVGDTTSDVYSRTTGRTTAGNYIADDATLFVQKTNGDWTVTTGANFKRGNNAINYALDSVNKTTKFTTIGVGYSATTVATSATNYAFVTSGVATVANASGDNVYSFTIWDGKTSQDVTTSNTYSTTSGKALSLAKGGVIAYSVNADGTIKIEESYDGAGDTDTATTGPDQGLYQSAVLAYDPTPNKDGDYSISLSTAASAVYLGAAGNTRAAANTAPLNTVITSDTTVLYVNHDGSNWTGIEGGSVRLATETATTGTFYTNAAYVYRDTGTSLEVLVIEIDNNWADGAM